MCMSGNVTCYVRVIVYVCEGWQGADWTVSLARRLAIAGAQMALAGTDGPSPMGEYPASRPGRLAVELLRV